MSIREARFHLIRWVAWHLPRSVVYWCAMRLGANATTGKWATQEVPKLTFMDAIERWERP